MFGRKRQELFFFPEWFRPEFRCIAIRVQTSPAKIKLKEVFQLFPAGVFSVVLLPFADRLRRSQVLIFVGGINQHYSHNIIWTLTGVNPDVVSTHRVTDENVRAFFTGRLQQLFQFVRNLQAAARFRTGIAPAISGAVVGTHAGELRDLRLHHQPVKGRAAASALKYYRRRSLSATVDIHADRTSLNEVSTLRETSRVTPSADHLVECASDRQAHDN